MSFFGGVKKAFGNVGNFVVKNVKSAISDIGDSAGSLVGNTIKGVTGGLVKGQLIQTVGSQGASFGGFSLGSNFQKTASEVGQIQASTSAQKIGGWKPIATLPSGATVSPSSVKSNMVSFWEKTKVFVQTNIIAIFIVLGVVGLLLFTIPKIGNKSKTSRRTPGRKRKPTAGSARSRQLAALAKGRATRARNLRAKKRK